MGARTPVATAWLRPDGPDPVAAAVAVGRALGLPALCGVEDLGPVGTRTDVRPAVAAALDLPVGIALSAAVSALLPADLSTRERVEVATAAKRCETSASGLVLVAALGVGEAMVTDAVDDAAAGRPDRFGRRSSNAAVGQVLGPQWAMASRSATGVVSLARYAEEHAPAALDAVADARIPASHLDVLVAVARVTAPSAHAALETETIRHPRWSPGQLRARLQSLAAQLDPDWTATAAAEGRDARDVFLGPSRRPGCRRVVAELPELWAQAVLHAVGGVARRAADCGLRLDGTREERSVAQLRADHFVAALTGLTSASDPSVPAPEDLAQLAEVQVVVAAAFRPTDGLGGDGGGSAGPPPVTPLPFRMPDPVSAPAGVPGLARVPVVVGRATLTEDSDHPASVPGAGPLDAVHVRWLSAHARYRWLHVERSAGHLLHRHALTHPPPSPGRGWGSATPPPPPPLPEKISAAITHAGYVPGHLLRAHVEVRDATCIGPGHFHPARTSLGTQLDHTIEYGQVDARTGGTGATEGGNLGAACRGAHQAKTHGGWRLRQPSPGTFEWTSPHGHRYTRHAEPVLPGWAQLPAEHR